MLKLSKYGSYAGNPIEEEDKLANSIASKGKKVLRLHRGDPAAYFPTPKYIVNAYLHALRSGKTGYSFHAGITELREAIAKRHRRLRHLNADPENVLVTQGVSEAIMFLSASLTDPGDMAIIFRPYYVLYPTCLEVEGGVPIYVDCKEEDRFRINPDNLRKALKSSRGKRIKFMIFSNPSNPTGSVTRKQELSEIVDIANDNDIFIVSDEIYDELVFNGAKFTSLSEVSKGVPSVIFGGASKGFDSTGFRIGYAIFPETDRFSKEVRERMAKYAQMRLSSNTPAQYAFARALNDMSIHQKTVASMVKMIEKRANFTSDLINESEFMSSARPEGAFYALARINMQKIRFKNDEDLSRRLLIEEGVQITRGSGFGAPGHIRIVTLAPENQLELAIRKINKFFVRHSK
ncbi:MAG: aminotransferase class I/II-fold pyridoxal phosphate-dependent enzyme [Candidatus Micrarchaeota archaeon]|nr:aminotransferase class I/II-fold pyridoxal phosphate-dependent enzyme [Candidatus Micrarchaeota archaeon]MDE1834609.1 aminotransferase class I/II-fold pyridoxal phosphate-dependent enzyme [Candidatus Micrarchaeota archaeon]MDE1859321.1 aminotransferase class I/II-fold pyridoxal phosphate-dependent enzyme [Candidatus Micrarchaeota archaeon]